MCWRPSASQALNILLASVVTVPADHQSTGHVDTTDPPYTRDRHIEAAIRGDIAEQHDLGLTGAATAHEHWSRPANEAKLVPGPPTELALISTPGTTSDAERNLRVAQRMTRYRLTIVGGLAKQTIYRDLKQYFGVESTEVRWIETERSREPPLNRLKGMQPESDIVFCVTGWIGHAESQKVIELSRKCGVKCVPVRRRSEIIDELRQQLGD